MNCFWVAVHNNVGLDQSASLHVFLVNSFTRNIILLLGLVKHNLVSLLGVPEKQEIGKRLRSWGVERFGTVSRMADALDMSFENLSQYLSGRALPGNKLQSKLNKLGCDTIWLMYGKSAESPESEIAKRFAGALYPVVSHIRAGRGGVKTTYEYESKQTLEGPSDPRHKGSLYFAVKGDSMEPRWEQGDFVLVNPKLKPKNGEYGVVCWDGDDGALKKVFYQKDQVVLQSLNLNYPAISVKKETIWFLGKVVLTKHKE